MNDDLDLEKFSQTHKDYFDFLMEANKDREGEELIMDKDKKKTLSKTKIIEVSNSEKYPYISYIEYEKDKTHLIKLSLVPIKDNLPLIQKQIIKLPSGWELNKVS